MRDEWILNTRGPSRGGILISDFSVDGFPARRVVDPRSRFYFRGTSMGMDNEVLIFFVFC